MNEFTAVEAPLVAIKFNYSYRGAPSGDKGKLQLSLPDGSPLPDGSRACTLPDQSLPDGSRAHRACATLRHCRQRNTIAG